MQRYMRQDRLFKPFTDNICSSPEEHLQSKSVTKGKTLHNGIKILLKLTFQSSFLKRKTALSGAYNRHCLPANKLRFQTDLIISFPNSSTRKICSVLTMQER